MQVDRQACERVANAVSQAVSSLSALPQLSFAAGYIGLRMLLFHSPLVRQL